MTNSKKLVAIVFSDLHLNIWAKFNENNHRTLNGFKVLDQLAGICTNKRVPALFCGDFFHKPESMDQELYLYVHDWLNDLYEKYPKFKIFAIEGNHDLAKVNTVDKLQRGWLKGLEFEGGNHHPITVISPKTPPAMIGKGIMVYGVPYIDHNTGLSEMLKKIRLIKDFKSVLLLHTDYPGARDTDGRVVDSVENLNLNTLNRFDLVLCGHIHKAQKLGKKVYMIGAPIQQRRTDRNCEMGYWELYEDLSMKFVPLIDYPVFIDVESEDQVKDDGNYYTVLPKKETVAPTVQHNITKHLSKKKLAHKYLKYKGIKDSNKENLLIKILKEAESC